MDTFQEAKEKPIPQPAEEANKSGEESQDNIPEELKPFVRLPACLHDLYTHTHSLLEIERRIMPRRSTRSAKTNFKDLAEGKTPAPPPVLTPLLWMRLDR